MNGAASQVPAGWEGILSPGERILWQGRPNARFTLRGHSLALVFVGGVFTAVALLFIAVGIAVGDLIFALFPLIHLGAGLAMMIGPPLFGAHARRNTWYTLTDRRAVIATDFWPKGRDMALYDIGPDSPLRLIDRPFPGVHFAMHHHRTKTGTRVVPFGFDRITDAKQVFDLMQLIKQGKA
jgi:hypothetical protein